LFRWRHLGDEAQDFAGGHVGLGRRAIFRRHVIDEALRGLMGSLFGLALAQEVE